MSKRKVEGPDAAGSSKVKKRASDASPRRSDLDWDMQVEQQMEMLKLRQRQEREMLELKQQLEAQRRGDLPLTEKEESSDSGPIVKPEKDPASFPMPDKGKSKSKSKDKSKSKGKGKGKSKSKGKGKSKIKDKLVEKALEEAHEKMKEGSKLVKKMDELLSEFDGRVMLSQDPSPGDIVTALKGNDAPGVVLVPVSEDASTEIKKNAFASIGEMIKGTSPVAEATKARLAIAEKDGRFVDLGIKESEERFDTRLHNIGNGFITPPRLPPKEWGKGDGKTVDNLDEKVYAQENKRNGEFIEEIKKTETKTKSGKVIPISKQIYKKTEVDFKYDKTGAVYNTWKNPLATVYPIQVWLEAQERGHANLSPLAWFAHQADGSGYAPAGHRVQVPQNSLRYIYDAEDSTVVPLQRQRELATKNNIKETSPFRSATRVQALFTADTGVRRFFVVPGSHTKEFKRLLQKLHGKKATGGTKVLKEIKDEFGDKVLRKFKQVMAKHAVTLPYDGFVLLNEDVWYFEGVHNADLEEGVSAEQPLGADFKIVNADDIKKVTGEYRKYIKENTAAADLSSSAEGEEEEESRAKQQRLEDAIKKNAPWKRKNVIFRAFCDVVSVPPGQQVDRKTAYDAYMRLTQYAMESGANQANKIAYPLFVNYRLSDAGTEVQRPPYYGSTLKRMFEKFTEATSKDDAEISAFLKQKKDTNPGVYALLGMGDTDPADILAAAGGDIVMVPALEESEEPEGDASALVAAGYESEEKSASSKGGLSSLDISASEEEGEEEKKKKREEDEIIAANAMMKFFTGKPTAAKAGRMCYECTEMLKNLSL